MNPRSTLPLLCAGLLIACAAHGQQVPVAEKTLPNGMKILMLERQGEPAVSGGWVAKVGSSNERPGITGIAHLFEHMMFKGTPTIGTTDYAKDQQIIQDQEDVREQMRQEERKMREMYRRGEITDMLDPDQKTKRYQELEKKFKELIQAQREILVKNEFDKIYTAAGASGMNAFTTHDLTGYFITVPANKLELWMWMESERLLHPVFREFYAERDVVFEERRMRTESTPLGRFEEQFESMFWVSHPYTWPVIGWPSDIPAISKAQADAFYDLYYAPQNITLVLVGDFQQSNALELAERYFGRIPRGPHQAPDVVTLELEQKEEKRINAQAEVNPQVDIMWHSVPFGHPDSYVLDVLSEVLSSRTGRLYKGLVLGKEVATSAFARQDSRKWAGLFNAGGEAKDGHTPEEVEQGIYAEIDKLKEELVPDLELQKVKNQFAAYEYRKLSNNFYIMLQLIFYEGLGDWREINNGGKAYQAVTAEDIQRVAKKYFTAENRAVAIYTRKPGKSADEDPDLIGLDAQQKSIIHRIVAALQEETSVENLQMALQQMEARAGQGDAKQQQFMKIYRKKIEARIQKLKSASN